MSSDYHGVVKATASSIADADEELSQLRTRKSAGLQEESAKMRYERLQKEKAEGGVAAL